MNPNFWTDTPPMLVSLNQLTTQLRNVTSAGGLLDVVAQCDVYMRSDEYSRGRWAAACWRELLPAVLAHPNWTDEQMLRRLQLLVKDMSKNVTPLPHIELLTLPQGAATLFRWLREAGFTEEEAELWAAAVRNPGANSRLLTRGLRRAWKRSRRLNYRYLPHLDTLTAWQQVAAVVLLHPESSERVLDSAWRFIRTTKQREQKHRSWEIQNDPRDY